MAAGEYTSVASQRELVAGRAGGRAAGAAAHPEDELEELAALYESRGVEPALAREVARQLSQDPEQALEIHAREELGIDPGRPALADGRRRSPRSCPSRWARCCPVLPYLLGAVALWPAVVLALLGLFACGALVARVTARPWWFSGLRQLALGGAAAAVTYALGAFFGTALG